MATRSWRWGPWVARPAAASRSRLARRIAARSPSPSPERVSPARAKPSSGVSPRCRSSAITVRARASPSGEPIGIGGFTSYLGGLGEQLVACAHRGFVAGGVVGMARFESEHQPVQKTSPVTSAPRKQSVHRRGQPEDRKPFRKAVDRRSRAVDPNLASFGCRGERSGSKVGTPKACRDRKAAGAVASCHFREACPAQAPAGREQRDGFENIGLSDAVLAVEADKTRTGFKPQFGIVAELAQLQPGDCHFNGLGQSLQKRLRWVGFGPSGPQGAPARSIAACRRKWCRTARHRSRRPGPRGSWRRP